MKSLIEVSFVEKNGELFFRPYGIFGNDIKITKEDKVNLSKFLRKYYLFVILFILFSSFFPTPYFIFIPPILLISYMKKIRAYKKFPSEKNNVTDHFIHIAKASSFFLLISLTIGSMLMFFASLSLFFLKQEILIPIITSLFFGICFMSSAYWLWLKIKMNKKNNFS